MRLEHPGPVGALATSGEYLASGAWDGELRLWHAVSGELLGRCQSPVGGVRSLALTQDPPMPLVSGLAGFCQLKLGPAGLETGSPVEGIPPAADISLSGDGRAILTANPPLMLDLASGQTRRMRARTRLARETLTFAHRCRFAAHGRYLLVSAPEVVMVLEGFEPYATRAMLQWSARADSPWVGPLGSSSDGRIVAAICDHQVLVWSLDDDPRLLDLPGPVPDVVYQLAFSPDGRWLAVSSDRTVHLRSTVNLAEMHRREGPTARLTDLCFDAAGRLFASSEDGGVYRWDTVD